MLKDLWNLKKLLYDYRWRDELKLELFIKLWWLKNEFIYYLLNDFGGDINDKNCVFEI